MSTSCPTITKVQLEPLYRGNSKVINIRVADSSDSPIDITGDTLILTVKTHKSATTNLYQQTNTTHSNPTQGLSQFTIPSADSMNFPIATVVFDIQWNRSDGNVFTTTEGTFEVVEPVNTP